MYNKYLLGYASVSPQANGYSNSGFVHLFVIHHQSTTGMSYRHKCKYAVRTTFDRFSIAFRVVVTEILRENVPSSLGLWMNFLHSNIARCAENHTKKLTPKMQCHLLLQNDHQDREQQFQGKIGQKKLFMGARGSKTQARL